MVAGGTPADLVAAYQPVKQVHFTAPPGADLGFVGTVSGVAAVDRAPDGTVRVSGTGPLLARVAHALVARGIEPDDLRPELPTLEDVYLALTADHGAGSGSGG